MIKTCLFEFKGEGYSGYQTIGTLSSYNSGTVEEYSPITLHVPTEYQGKNFVDLKFTYSSKRTLPPNATNNSINTIRNPFGPKITTEGVLFDHFQNNLTADYTLPLYLRVAENKGSGYAAYEDCQFEASYVDEDGPSDEGTTTVGTETIHWTVSYDDKSLLKDSDVNKASLFIRCPCLTNHASVSFNIVDSSTGTVYVQNASEQSWVAGKIVAEEITLTNPTNVPSSPRVHGTKLQFVIDGVTAEESIDLLVVANRLAPDVSLNPTTPFVDEETDIEDNPIYETYGLFLQSKNKIKINEPIFTLDTDAKAELASASLKIIELGKTIQYDSDNECFELPVLVNAGTYTYQIEITDSYGKSAIKTFSGTDAIVVTQYAAPSIKSAPSSYLTRYKYDSLSEKYVQSDDGQYIATTLLVSVSPVFNISSATQNAWNISSVATGDSSTIVRGALNIPIVTRSKGSSSIINLGQNNLDHYSTGPEPEDHDVYTENSDWRFTLTISDLFSTSSQSFSVNKAGAIFNIERYGVSVGMRSDGTEEEPRFSSAYETMLYKNIFVGTSDAPQNIYVGKKGTAYGLYDIDGNPWLSSGDDDTGWSTTGIVPTGYGANNTVDNEDLMIRKINNTVTIRGSINIGKVISSTSGNTPYKIAEIYPPFATNHQISLPLTWLYYTSSHLPFSSGHIGVMIHASDGTKSDVTIYNNTGTAFGTNLNIALNYSFVAN